MTAQTSRHPGTAWLKPALAILWFGVAVLCGACSPAAPPQQAGGNSTAHTDHAAHNAPQTVATPRIPDHFTAPDAGKPFPQTLDPKTFSSPSVVKAYQLAKDIPEVLAQQPCYCYCDAGFGHKSLLHCHVDDHSAT